MQPSSRASPLPVRGVFFFKLIHTVKSSGGFLAPRRRGAAGFFFFFSFLFFFIFSLPSSCLGLVGAASPRQLNLAPSRQINLSFPSSSPSPLLPHLSFPKPLLPHLPLLPYESNNIREYITAKRNTKTSALTFIYANLPSNNPTIHPLANTLIEQPNQPSQLARLLLYQPRDP